PRPSLVCISDGRRLTPSPRKRKDEPMRRIFWALPAALLLALLAPPGRAAEADLAGTCKLVLLTPQRPIYWLLAFEVKDGKLAGKVLAVGEKVRPTTLEDLKLSGDKLSFGLNMEGAETLSFEGVVAKDSPKTIRGALMLQDLVPAL